MHFLLRCLGGHAPLSVKSEGPMTRRLGILPTGPARLGCLTGRHGKLWPWSLLRWIIKMRCAVGRVRRAPRHEEQNERIRTEAAPSKYVAGVGQSTRTPTVPCATKCQPKNTPPACQSPSGPSSKSLRTLGPPFLDPSLRLLRLCLCLFLFHAKNFVSSLLRCLTLEDFAGSHSSRTSLVGVCYRC